MGGADRHQSRSAGPGRSREPQPIPRDGSREAGERWRHTGTDILVLPTSEAFETMACRQQARPAFRAGIF
jgi:hypothetical protein